MRITDRVTRNIIRKLLKGEDYRIEVVNIINAEFLQFAVNFFKSVVSAKLKDDDITVDWYKKAFLDPSLSAKEIAINSGLNKKTIHNMYNSSTKDIVLDASTQHYDLLYDSIKNLVDSDPSLELNLTIKFNGVSVDLNVSESLIVINTLAVKRAELRGGLWSTAGKRVEKPLMLTLCKLYGVAEINYAERVKGKELKEEEFEREIDFYLIHNEVESKCEVKLMGSGNPESADAVIARASAVFVADKLSDTNKKQLNQLKVNWVELRSSDGYKRFEEVLDNLKIPHSDLKKDTDKELDRIFSEIFTDKKM